MFSSIFKAALILGAAPAFAELTWKSDVDVALIEAAKQNKPVLVEFVGSDWCSASQIFTEKVLNTEKCEKAIRDRFVFVQIDFPHKKEMPDEQRLKNYMWRTRLGIKGFPSVVLLDQKGLPYASMVAGFNNPDDFLTVLSILNKNKLIRDAALEKSRHCSGKDRIQALVRALRVIPEESRHTFYAAEMKQLEDADQTDSTGFIKEQRYKETLFKEEQEIYNKIAQHQANILEKQTDFVLEELQAMEKAKQWLPESRQKLLLSILFLKGEANPNAIVASLKEIIDLDPRSQEAGMARNMIRNFRQEETFVNHASIN